MALAIEDRQKFKIEPRTEFKKAWMRRGMLAGGAWRLRDNPVQVAANE
jgi:hypothetical protein